MHSLRLAPTLFSVVLAMISARHARAQQGVPSGRIESGTLSFEGRATMGDFTGTTTAITGEMFGGPALSAVRGWVEAPVTTLKTGNDKRDRDLNKSMESAKYQVIRYELDSVTPVGFRGDTADVTLAGRFLIHGVTRDVEFPARVIMQGERTRVQAQTQLNLKHYQIGGLTKMLGMLRMNEDIVVHIDLVFAASPGAGPATLSASAPEGSAP